MFCSGLTSFTTALYLVNVFPRNRAAPLPSVSCVSVCVLFYQVSNYDYLVFLNTVAGRTVNDLTQYPVFPWVVQDFESATLNLDDESVYR